MNSSDLTERFPNDPSHSSALDTSSPDSTQRAFSRSDCPVSEPSSSSSRAKPNNQDQQYAFNEVTPIVSSSSAGRCYQSTDNPKDPDVVHGNGNPTGPTQGKRGRNGSQDPVDPNRQPESPWYRRFADKFGTVELDNEGSVARDHLALERTFLAWLRTSLAFASIGIAVTQLFRLTSSKGSSGVVDDPAAFPPLLSPSFYEPSSSEPSDSARLRGIGKPLGTTFVGIAIVVLLVGFHRYFESQYWIIRGKFPASRGSVALIGALTAALIITAFVVILSVAPNSVERT